MTEKRTPDQIWEGDLFNRKDEAGSLIAYIDSIWDRNIGREDARSYTIAVDAGYGEGKTFFLKRLAEHLELNHPVAFVDAWKDDIADEPLTALAATLKKALGPLIKESGTVESTFNNVLEKTGKVAVIAAKGALRKAASFALTTQGVDAIEAVIGDITEDSEEAIKDGADNIVNDSADTLKNPSKLMASRIEEFEAGIKAVQELKDSLEALVASIKDRDNTYPPIVIIIDELDRCRPTYSVKLLEEIKHLFDVPGIVFVLGMYGDQLSNSISAAYGPNFDGKAYLRRFINRRYSLKTPDLEPLVTNIIAQSGHKTSAFHFPEIISTTNGGYRSSAHLISIYLTSSGLTARDAYGILDLLLTAHSISGRQNLLMPYILPLIISHYKECSLNDIFINPYDREIEIYDSYSEDGQLVNITAIEWAKKCDDMAKLPLADRHSSFHQKDLYAHYINETIRHSDIRKFPLASPIMYHELIRTVGRFTNPDLEN